MKLGTRKEYHEKIKNKPYWKDDCPFCKNEDIIWEWKYWNIITNMYPYSGNEKHIMAVPHRHIIYSNELSVDELVELKDVHNFIKNFFWNEHYFSFTRETMWSRSVEHLHIHFLTWKLKGRYLRKMLEDQWYPIVEDRM